MNTQELAKTSTNMCAKGEFDAAGKKFWPDDVVSREPMTGTALIQCKGFTRTNAQPSPLASCDTA